MTRNQLIGAALHKIAAAYESDVDTILKGIDYTSDSPYAREMLETATDMATLGKQLSKNNWYHKINPARYLVHQPAYRGIKYRLDKIKAKHAEWRRIQAAERAKQQAASPTPQEVNPAVKPATPAAPVAPAAPAAPASAQIVQKAASALGNYWLGGSRRFWY